MINSASTGASLAQQQISFRSGDNSNSLFWLEALILEGSQITHFSLQGDKLDWGRVAVVSNAASAPAALMGSPYVGNNEYSYTNLEALILEGNDPVHYWMDRSETDQPKWNWNRGPVITTKATGHACMIQSAYRADVSKPDNFEVPVPEGNSLVHYWRKQRERRALGVRDHIDVKLHRSGQHDHGGIWQLRLSQLRSVGHR